ncbi:heme ABC transporter ATP-binding protein [Pigmentiphaga soli]|uniref:Heme ABC transporter ATP-binding protein n=1 Tax=Pigmentiphaga soli TaxID=1007095 RepID=A0ABP8GWQ2_9BURK
MKPIVHASGLAVARRQPGAAARTVLHGVDCMVEPGEVVMLIGPNGAGKSTLLAALAGDLKPAAGGVWFDGRPLARWAPAELARRRAVLPQHAALNLPFTAAEVVRLACMARLDGRRAVSAVVEAAMAETGVDHLAGRAVTALSGGEQARVHLARALAQIWPAEPSASTRNLLLLDEPCASLDPHFQHALCAAVRGFVRRTGAGALISLHDMNLAAQYGDRIVALQDGRAVAEGLPREVLTRAFVRDCFAVDADLRTVDAALLVATRPLADTARR